MSTTGALLVAAGALALRGTDSHTTAIIPIVVGLGVVGFIFAVGLAVEHFMEAALAMILVCPILGALYFAALHVVPGSGPAVGAVLIALGVAGAWLGFSGFRRLASGAETPQ